MININKFILTFLASLVGVIIIAIMPKNANVIDNAIVNEKNGDIAFCFADTSNEMLQINLFDKNGELLFKKNLSSKGGIHADFIFDEDLLVVYVGRTEEVYCFDRTGADATSRVTIDELDEMTGTFVGWKKSFAQRSYSLNGTVYLYEVPVIFNDKARLSIKNDNIEKTIYESS